MTKRSITLIAAGLLLASAVFAQGNPTGRISGTVSHEGDPLPGVLITVESENLQQTRQATSQANGAYLVGPLPPGQYKLTFELDGLDEAYRRVEVSVAQVQRLDVEMSVATLSEQIVVTDESATISETSTVASTVTQDVVEMLALNRDIIQAVNLVPGTATTGPGNNISISGAQSYDNLYLINGVPVNENLRGQASNLFIEDAIQETTVATAGVSAEYGRFSGGVVNTVTKSGGNELSGSLRANLDNDEWSSTTPFGEAQEDEINETFEATLGGSVLKDRLWFFVAGRSRETATSGETSFSNFAFPETRDETRVEGKLTASLTNSHQVVLSAVDITDDRSGNVQSTGALDRGAVNDNVSFPQDSFAANYTGLLSDNFFIEAQYSERSLEFLGIGGFDSDPRSGTPLRDSSRNAAVYHQPIFCGNCPNPDTRQHENVSLKGSYFLSTENLGSHDLIFGVDTFDDITSGDNVQSATGFDAWSTSAIIRGNEVFPQVLPLQGSFIINRPIFESSLGTDFVSKSAYVNDRWQLGDRWSFNLGVRYDENDGVDSAGNTISNDDNISPRLGVNYDTRGDGSLVIHGTAGRYVTRLANGVADSTSAAGNPAVFAWLYGGPAINPDPNAAELVSSDDALDILFDWFESVGGLDNRTFQFLAVVPGSTSRIDGSLASPNADELTLGFTKRFGSRGLLRADYVRREFGDFYFQRTDASTGTVIDPNGDPADLILIQNNDDLLEREYDGLHTSFRYRLTDRLDLGGNWTWSHARGNFNGETVRTGPVSGTVGQYPEYKAFAEHNPRRNLAIDQRHKVRAWLLWDAITTARHQLTVSFLQNFFSGQSYGALGGVDSSPFVTNPGYVTPPSAEGVAYYFTSPDAFTTDDITRTDLALNYAFSWNLGGRAIEFFVQPEVINVFDEQGVVDVDQFIQDATSAAGFEAFDPFTETPVQGVHWDFGNDFGQPVDDNDYQQPRTFRLSVGIRF